MAAAAGCAWRVSYGVGVDEAMQTLPRRLSLWRSWGLLSRVVPLSTPPGTFFKQLIDQWKTATLRRSIRTSDVVAANVWCPGEPGKGIRGLFHGGGVSGYGTLHDSNYAYAYHTLDGELKRCIGVNSTTVSF